MKTIKNFISFCKDSKIRLFNNGINYQSNISNSFDQITYVINKTNNPNVSDESLNDINNMLGQKLSEIPSIWDEMKKIPNVGEQLKCDVRTHVFSQDPWLEEIPNAPCQFRRKK